MGTPEQTSEDDEERLQKKSLNFILRKKFEKVAELERLTGVKLPDEVVQEGYREFMSKGDWNAVCGLTRFSNVEPDIDPDLMKDYLTITEEKQVEAVREGDVERARQIRGVNFC